MSDTGKTCCPSPLPAVEAPVGGTIANAAAYPPVGSDIERERGELIAIVFTISLAGFPSSSSSTISIPLPSRRITRSFTKSNAIARVRPTSASITVAGEFFRRPKVVSYRGPANAPVPSRKPTFPDDPITAYSPGNTVFVPNVVKKKSPVRPSVRAGRAVSTS